MNAKGTKYPAVPITMDEVRAVVEQITGSRPLAVRNRALVWVMAGSGARVSEALGLYPSDVEVDGLRIRDGKGHKARKVALRPEARPHLEAWIALRGTLGLNGRKPLFCSVASGAKGKGVRQPGAPIDPSYVRRLLPKLAKDAGIDKRVHAHGLRHTHASDLLARRAPLNAISGQLGHSSVATTDTYLAKIAPAERIAALEAAWADD